MRDVSVKMSSVVVRRWSKGARKSVRLDAACLRHRCDDVVADGGH